MQKLWVIVLYPSNFFSTTHSSRALWPSIGSIRFLNLFQGWMRWTLYKIPMNGDTSVIDDSHLGVKFWTKSFTYLWLYQLRYTFSLLFGSHRDYWERGKSLWTLRKWCLWDPDHQHSLYVVCQLDDRVLFRIPRCLRKCIYEYENLN